MIPQISVSLAPPPEVPREPYSPFSPTFFTMSDEADTFRPHYLTSPVTLSSPLSPLRPSDSPVMGTGLERQRFEAILKASKERSAAAGAKKAADLRKEVALKVHRSKQVERRALFLSKLQEPPSPSAICLPKTPPESPAIFHYTLPSPGLNSPLSLFDALMDDTLDSVGLHSVEPWVEQVDFRLPEDMQSSKSTVYALHARISRPSKPLPSLDQITARLQVSASPRPERLPMRLPAFLKPHSREPPQTPIPTDVVVASSRKSRPALPIGVGRLRIPAPSLSISSPQALSASAHSVPPVSPDLTLAPKLKITTTIVPRSSNTSPHSALSERNVFVLTSRARTAKDMLSTLKRRTHPSDQGLTGHDQDEEERKGRRRSSPAEMETMKRSGFTHPILAMPGGF